eukprot:5052547-Pyramimonas_sp.AAC.1
MEICPRGSRLKGRHGPDNDSEEVSIGREEGHGMEAFSADEEKAHRHQSPLASARGVSLARGPARRWLALQ